MSQVQRLLCCSPVLEDTHKPIESANCSFRRESDSYHVISKYKQSDWFSRFLVMLSQQAQDFGRSAPDPFIHARAGSGNETTNKLEVCDHQLGLLSERD